MNPEKLYNRYCFLAFTILSLFLCNLLLITGNTTTLSCRDCRNASDWENNSYVNCCFWKKILSNYLVIPLSKTNASDIVIPYFPQANAFHGKDHKPILVKACYSDYELLNARNEYLLKWNYHRVPVLDQSDGIVLEENKYFRIQQPGYYTLIIQLYFMIRNKDQKYYFGFIHKYDKSGDNELIKFGKEWSGGTEEYSAQSTRLISMELNDTLFITSTFNQFSKRCQNSFIQIYRHSDL